MTFYTVFDDKKQLFKVSSLFDSLDESEDIVKDLMDSGTFMYIVDERPAYDMGGYIYDDRASWGI